MTLLEKKQKLAALISDARAKLDAGDLQAYNKMDADIDSLSVEIKAEEKQLERENALAGIPEPAKGKPAPDGVKATDIAASPEYKAAFFKAVRGGKSSLNDAERAMLQNVMSVGTDTKGGFLVVPAEMEGSIRDLLARNVVMRSLATVITATAERKMPFVTSYGAASWIGENGTYPKIDDAFAVQSIGSHKLGKIIPVSEELVNDIDYDLTAHINRSFARSFGEAEEQAYLTGDGTDKPTGVLVDAETGLTTAAASAITADELLDLYYALKSGYRAGATFLLADGTEKLLRKLKNSTTGDYMWQPGLTAGQPNTLLGRPVRTSDYMPAFAAGAKAVAFGDFSQYTIKDTRGMQMQVLGELYAENGQVGFKGYERTDGKLLIPEAVKLLVVKAA